MIDLRIENNKNFGNHMLMVFANEAPIGDLMPFENQLCWSPNPTAFSVRFQFRNETTFMEVVQRLQEYKNKQGFKYLVISSNNGGYAAQLGKEMIQRAGFKQLPNTNPDHFYLE